MVLEAAAPSRLATTASPPARPLEVVRADDAPIRLEHVSKVYEPTPGWMRPFVRTHIQQPVQALVDVGLTVRAGEICAIVGPNGAGKTTLFRIIVGLTTPSSGRGTVLGYDVEHESKQVRQVVGWMSAEDRSLLMRATCRENLHLHGRLQGISSRELGKRIDTMLDLVVLSRHADSIVASLSAGMKARLRLARALLAGPRVLLLDEPTGAIDPIAAHALLELIVELTREYGLAALLSSHRLEEIEALQSNALLLDGGRVRYSGDLDHLRSSLEQPLLELTFGTVRSARRAASVFGGLDIDATVEGLTVRCRLEHGADLGTLLAALGRATRGDIHRVQEVPMPLRDLIAHVYSPPSTNGAHA
jgi:ABC-2 type transport system ATP-binding protein